MRKLIVGAAAILALLPSCSDEIVGIENDGENEIQITPVLKVDDKQECLETFAKVLSAAVAERKDVREFLKSEAVKQFDCNYDILYQLVKDSVVGADETFERVLTAYTTEDSLKAITSNVPLLNIYLTRTAFLGVYPEELDVDDNEIPVAVAGADSTMMFLAGASAPSLPSGVVPGFHVFVVGENSRVVVAGAQMSESANKSVSLGSAFSFKSASFDGARRSRLKSVGTIASVLGKRAVEAYSHFNGKGGEKTQTAFQRDYIYYGITPDKTSGSLVKSVSEYLCYIKVPIAAYFTISDEKESDASVFGDPYIKQNSWTHYGAKPSESEVINALWQRGAYNFKVEVITSKESSASVAYIPLTPDQLWNFNIKSYYRHSTWFRHSKYVYSIEPNDFYAKDIFLDEPIDLGKWNIAEESVYRYIKMSEEDSGAEVSYQESFDMSEAKSNNFNGEIKVSIGMTDVTTSTSTSTANSSTTEKNSEVVTFRKLEKSDDLGTVRVYFYDPIIESKLRHSTTPYKLHTYNTGSVIFGITAK